MTTLQHGSADGFDDPSLREITWNPDAGVEHRISHGAIVGVISGFVFVFVLVGVGSLAVGLKTQAALSLGLFSGFWSGTMLGAMVTANAVYQRASSELHHREPGDPTRY